MVEHIEEPFHQTMTTGIDLGEVADLTKGIGTVAASSTADLYLGKNTIAALEDVNLHLGHHFLQVDSQKETCRSASDNSRLHLELGHLDGYHSTLVALVA